MTSPRNGFLLGLLAALALTRGAFAALPCQKTDIPALGFSDPPTRNQCDVGSCHSFTSIGLIEWSIYASYGVSVRLSEADLYVRSVVLSPEYYSGAHRKKGSAQYSIAEGADPMKEIAWAKVKGVATAKMLPYDERFLERYRRFRSDSDAILGTDPGLGGEGAASRSDLSNREINENYLLGITREGAPKVYRAREAVKQAIADMRLRAYPSNNPAHRIVMIAQTRCSSPK